MDFLVAPQTVGQAGPARGFPISPKDRTEKRLHPARPHEHPGRSGLKLSPIHFGKTLFEIVVADDHGERRIARPHTDTGRFQVPG